MTAQWCRFDSATARLTLHIHARPNARVTAAAGLYGDALKVHIAAPANDNRANAALIVWLAAVLELPRGAIRLKSGMTARRKVIEVQPATLAAAARAAALAG
jgi:uncharacterized protein YggU (UPF0235/DUF167 family)